MDTLAIRQRLVRNLAHMNATAEKKEWHAEWLMNGFSDEVILFLNNWGPCKEGYIHPQTDSAKAIAD